VTVPRCRTAKIALRARDVRAVRGPRFTAASALQDAAAITVNLESRIADVFKNSSALVAIRNGRKVAKGVKACLKNVPQRVCQPLLIIRYISAN